MAESITTDYSKQAESIKLTLPDGEIDIVVGTPLTEHPYDVVQYAGREIKVETCAEIIAKKMWHRGDRAKARDLFDLCAVAEAEPDAIAVAAPFMRKQGAVFLQRLSENQDVIAAEFDAIDVIGFKRSFAECLEQGRGIIEPLLVGPRGTER